MIWGSSIFRLFSIIFLALTIFAVIVLDLTQVKSIGAIVMGLLLAILSSVWSLEEHMKELFNEVKPDGNES